MKKKQMVRILSVFFVGFLLMGRSGTAQDQAQDPESYAALNKVLMPQSGSEVNLLPNPSFEQGTHLWSTVSTGNSRIVNLDHDQEWFLIDSTTSAHGRYSARLALWDNRKQNHLIQHDQWQQELLAQLKAKGQWPNYVHPFIISYYVPVSIGETYTVSFYAKAEVPGAEIIFHAASRYADWSQGTKESLTDEWKRYEFQFEAKDEYVTLLFGQDWMAPWDEDLPTKSFYWVDAIQLEAGTVPGPFELKPVVASLDSFERVVDISEPKSISFSLTNISSNSQSVRCRLVVRHFFKEKVYEKAFAQKKLAAGSSEILSADLNSFVKEVGYYTLELYVQGDDFDDVEVFRYAVIDESGVQDLKHQALFGYGSTLNANHKQTVDLYKRLGLGIMLNNSHNHMDPDHVALWETINAPVLYPIMKRYPHYLKLREIAEISDAALDTVMAGMRDYLAQYRHIKYWKIVNEPEHKWKHSFMYDPPQLVRYMERLYPLIKEVIPGAVVVSPDLANISQGSLDWVEEVLRLGGGDYFDVLAIHTYQKTPELPSLDKSLTKLERMANRYGFAGELWLTEGGHYLEQHFPPFEFDATIFEGHFDSKMPPFTEDLSGYPVGLALGARTTLIVLKHAARIRANTEWQLPNLGFETLSMMPRAHAMVYHGLARKLGNSSFVEEISLGKTIKCYLFEDPSGQAMAALWDFDRQLALGNRQPLTLQVFNPEEHVEATNIFGGALRTSREHGFDLLELSYMPQLLEAEDLATLKSALAKSYIRYEKKEALEIAFELADEQTLDLELFNQYHETLNGYLEIVINGEKSRQKYELSSQQAKTFSLGFQQAPEHSGATLGVNANVSVYDNQGVLLSSKELNSQIVLSQHLKKPLTIDGRLDDWSGISAGELGPDDHFSFQKNQYHGADDLSVKWYTSWDDEHFYLAVKVRDDIHLQQFEGNAVYQNDGIQLFFDMENNGTPEAPNLEDDYAWSLSLTPAGPQAFKAYVPSWQTAFLKQGLSDDVALAVVRDEDITTYELRIPTSNLRPLSLKSGSVFGMAIMVNDADHEQRETALMNTEGGEPWKNPGVYSDIILMK
ncbi:sugar-binding protein [Marinoscillum furvescens]|nr:sugar-binding protein [Marinoscillum furvescens]